ncbi:MAG TPA: LacI family DNA-binding transcriptional regulator, partial [Gaiellaceae bacterium]|nr:LacI family DNA-binding transcriptional regulator [Gaiellaceae bacterium]
MAERRVRLRDVAERAGVSVGSASQAFGRPELVSDDVRERVLAAADELGYPGPDPAARRLRTGRAGAIGLIFSERLAYQFTDPASPPFLRGVSLAIQQAPTGLLLIPDSRQRDEATRLVREAVV